MPTGKVKWFNKKKRFGFILPEGGGDDLFVHATSIQDGELKENDTVEYKVGNGRKGPCAIEVMLVEQTEVEQSTYLHRGIAGRSFERRFQLADHVVVKGANLENGLLHVDLVRELPEAMKPRTIPIETKSDKPRVIDSKAA